jgi:hypothetical protein
MITCPYCNSATPENQNCIHCGAPIPAIYREKSYEEVLEKIKALLDEKTKPSFFSACYPDGNAPIISEGGHNHTLSCSANFLAACHTHSLPASPCHDHGC